MGRLVKNALFVQNQVDSVGLPTGTMATTPVAPLEGQMRFNTDLHHIEVFDGNAWDTIDGSSKFRVNQLAHNLTLFQAVYFNGTKWMPATASSLQTTGIGVVSRVVSPDIVEIQQTGVLTNLTGLTPGAFYFVDDLTAGLLTVTEPALLSNPLFYAISQTSGLVLPFRATSSAGANGIAVDFTALPIFNWTIAHNRGTTRVAYQAYDINHVQIYPDIFTIDDSNNVTASFSVPQSGTLHLIFF